MRQLAVRVAAIAAVLIAACMLAVFVVQKWSDGGDEPPEESLTDGPLRDANGPYVTFFEERRLPESYPDPGDPVTDGMAVLRVDGQYEATLLGVETTGVDDVVEQVAAYVITDHRRGVFGPFVGEFGDPGSRRHGDLLPVAGQRITSKDDLGLNLVIVYDVLRSDKLWARGDVIVRYESGGETYELHIESGLVFCPRTVTVRECNAFAEAAYPDFPG